MPTQRRVMLVDFSHPALYNPSYFLIPAAKSSTNLLAATLPFQTPVFHLTSYCITLNILKSDSETMLFAVVIGLDWNSLGNPLCLRRSLLFKS